MTEVSSSSSSTSLSSPRQQLPAKRRSSRVETVKNEAWYWEGVGVNFDTKKMKSRDLTNQCTKMSRITDSSSDNDPVGQFDDSGGSEQDA